MEKPRAERRVVTVQRLVAAAPERIFEVLTDIRQHSRIDGSHMLQGHPEGPDRLRLGSRFSMGMRQAGMDYRSVSTVVEFEPDRLIAWESGGEWRGHRIVGGQRWRYLLTPEGSGTLVAHSYVWGYARLAPLVIQLPGYPRRMGPAMARTLDRLAAHLAG